MLQEVTVNEVEAIRIGAGILGTGGGGNPYLGSLELKRLLQAKGPQPVINPCDLDDDAHVVVVGGVGAPTASIEKLPEGTEMLRAVRLLEAHLGLTFNAIAIAEIGGSNSMRPMIAGKLVGIPVVDSDGMGRAFPEIQMTTFLFSGDLSVSPFTMADASADIALVPHTISHIWAERIARNIAISMGARGFMAGYPMSGAHLKQSGIHHTLTLAHHLGQRVLDAQQQGNAVPEVIADTLAGRVIFTGKIVDVERRTTKGFARGSTTIKSYDDKETLRIEFQNEFLIAERDGEMLVTVPDSICIVIEETGEPVSTEILRYGMRVAVLGVPAAQALKTPHALEIVGPSAFGYDAPFTPLPGEVIGTLIR